MSSEVWQFAVRDEDGRIYGFCATGYTEDGEEVILSHCFKDGVEGVSRALRKMVNQLNEIPTIAFRWLTLGSGMSLEIMTGTQLTRGPSATARVKTEFGITKNLSKKKTRTAWEMLTDLAYRLHDQLEGDE